MTVSPLDITQTLRDLEDLVRSESEPGDRIDLFETFLAEAQAIAHRGIFAAVYEQRSSGVPASDIAEHFGCAPWTVVRWSNEYADDHSLPRLGRPARVIQAVRLTPRYIRARGGNS